MKFRFNRVFDFIISLILGCIPPILLFLVFWWISIPFAKDANIFKYAFVGLFAGVIVSVMNIRIWVRYIYRSNYPILMLIYGFYMVGIFGFFMGVPVVNILPGIVSGAYVAKRSKSEHDTMSAFNQKLRNLHIVNVLFLFPFLLASAYLALTDPYTASNLKGMFNLPYTVTQRDIITLILLGGASLLGIQYFLTDAVSRKLFRLQ